MAKVLFLNAPPRAGKDTVAEYLAAKYTNVRHVKFADHLKRMSHAMLGMYDITPRHFEDIKDIPNLQFPFNLKTHQHYTPREWYIFVAEEVIKPHLGIRHFGCQLAKEINPERDFLYVISDSGFAEEAEPIIELVGEDRCYQIQIHRTGCAFKTEKVKDSRSYWRDNRLQGFTIENDGTPEDLFRKIDLILTYPIQGVSYDNIRK